MMVFQWSSLGNRRCCRVVSNQGHFHANVAQARWPVRKHLRIIDFTIEYFRTHGEGLTLIAVKLDNYADQAADGLGRFSVLAYMNEERSFDADMYMSTIAARFVPAEFPYPGEHREFERCVRSLRTARFYSI